MRIITISFSPSHAFDYEIPDQVGRKLKLMGLGDPLNTGTYNRPSIKSGFMEIHYSDSTKIPSVSDLERALKGIPIDKITVPEVAGIK